MAPWLKVFLLISELSLALSSVVVSGDEEETIASLIKAKLGKQEELLKQLKQVTKAQNSSINLLNVTFEDTRDLQQEQINFLLKKTKS